MDSLTAISSWSGGKDSCLACFKAMKQGYKIQNLLHFISRESKRSCFHGIESRLMDLQAERIGIPIIQKEVTADMKEYEKEFKEAVSEIHGIEAMVFGDIYLDEHKDWVERVCKDLRIAPVEPLWGNPALGLVREFIKLGFRSVVVSAQADKFDKDFVGRTVDDRLIDELVSRKICPCGENGEFHSFVYDGPLFRAEIGHKRGEIVLRDSRFYFCDLRPI
jgi:uncharacterized protein (TIGR00290 family)